MDPRTAAQKDKASRGRPWSASAELVVTHSRRAAGVMNEAATIQVLVLVAVTVLVAIPSGNVLVWLVHGRRCASCQAWKRDKRRRI